ncbi:MAG TPA: ABC transporter substrate-binding protein, partial [Burkholderiales bacterium]|nr:ABC transporter substrate-binding protein [Burkholderiales bacterium]
MRWLSLSARYMPMLCAAMLGWSALAQISGEPAASLLLYTGADRAQRIVAAAQREGSLTLYTSIAEKDLSALVAPFEKKYGVKVKIWRASSIKILQRAISEAAAKRYEVDAIHMSAPE